MKRDKELAHTHNQTEGGGGFSVLAMPTLMRQPNNKASKIASNQEICPKNYKTTHAHVAVFTEWAIDKPLKQFCLIQ